MDSLRGIILMVLAMAGFAIEDLLIKQSARAVPVGMVLLVIGAAGGAVFWSLCRMRGIAVVTADLRHPAILTRNGAEMLGTMAFVTGLTLIPLSLASAILQATPIFVTLGAALVLGAEVGWRRWTAILVGFAGVLLILRPGLDAFDPNTLFVVAGMLGLAARDVASRRVPTTVPNLQLATYGFLSVIPAGAILLAVSGGAHLPDAHTAGLLGGAVAVGVLAYYAITAATRIGDIAVVTPFRYTRLLFALLLGMVFLGERPDALTLIGATIVIGSGLFILAREARLHAAARRTRRASAVPGPVR